jgi:predicted DNA-binding protein
MILRYDASQKIKLLVTAQLKEMTDFSFNPEKLPKKLELDLSPAVEEHLRKLAAATGRSLDELILEILDKALQEKEYGE